MPHFGPIPVDPPLILAPMAGITDHVYRLMLRRIGGVGLVTMEFISSEAITRGNARQRRKMFFSEEERPLSIQIYGSDAERMSAAAEIVEELAPDVCDINMGCPANKVLKGCAGAALMGDLPLARRIVRDVRRRLSIPLTVKFRLGLDDARRNFLDIGKMCEDEGAAAVALHARTARQMYTGRAERPAIAELKRHLSIPVVGNGDVETPGDAAAMLSETGCDAVMIGRATMKNPWVFRQTADLLAGREPGEASWEERRDLMLDHFSAIERTAHDAREALHKLRTMTGWYTHGLPNGRALRIRISSLATPADFRDAVAEFFEGARGEPELVSATA
jgi:tRNA-dihydrouridine synthase B